VWKNKKNQDWCEFFTRAAVIDVPVLSLKGQEVSLGLPSVWIQDSVAVST